MLSVVLDATTGSYKVTQHHTINNSSSSNEIFELSFIVQSMQGQHVNASLIVTSLDDTPKAFPLEEITFDESLILPDAPLTFSSQHLPHAAGADGAQIS